MPKAFVATGVCSETRVKYEGLEPFGHPRGPKLQENVCVCVLFVPRRLQKGFPEGHKRKTLVNNDQIWGVFVLSFSCPLHLLLRGSGFLFGAVLAAPSVPQGCLGGPIGVLCARTGAPSRGHRTVVIRCFWGLSGVLWGARWGLARFLPSRLAHFLDKLEVGLRS